MTELNYIIHFIVRYNPKKPNKEIAEIAFSRLELSFFSSNFYYYYLTFKIFKLVLKSLIPSIRFIFEIS